MKIARMKRILDCAITENSPTFTINSSKRLTIFYIFSWHLINILVYNINLKHEATFSYILTTLRVAVVHLKVSEATYAFPYI